MWLRTYLAWPYQTCSWRLVSHFGCNKCCISEFLPGPLLCNQIVLQFIKEKGALSIFGRGVSRREEPAGKVYVSAHDITN